eukprot:171808-Pelagomonas_calceolata.AAC.1
MLFDSGPGFACPGGTLYCSVDRCVGQTFMLMKRMQGPEPKEEEEEEQQQQPPLAGDLQPDCSAD